MNLESIQAQQAEILRVVDQQARTAERLMWVYLAVVALYIVLMIIAAVHCASKGPEKNNASWMMLIVLVPLGSILYWFFAPRSDDEIFQRKDGVFPSSPSAPPRNVNSLSIVESVNAAVAADVQKKRGRVYPQ